MMKIQIAATISADGFLSSGNYKNPWRWPGSKHCIRTLQKKADRLLSKNESVISLLNEKRNKIPVTYLAEATPDRLDLIKSLLLYRLVDELYLHVLPYNKGGGIRLFGSTLSSEWTLAGKRSLLGGGQYLIYHRVKDIP